MSIAIKVENLSKAYQLGEIGTGTISRDLERWFARKRGKEDPFLKIGEENDRTSKGTSDIVWSLRDLDFEIQQGDAIGIIGRNGAGKSTLLKLLSRVTSPTTGKIKARGRIASLLEVGTGFHPELTGRENIYLNGAILGMRKKEIDRKFDEIVDFSGVERYVDTPVKRYSSGMYVRLAFAVAAHLESEILIVDEVLAVGDAEFQKKCLGKMNQVSRGEGRTVLFVSHNIPSIRELCKKGILLQNGKLLVYSEIENVLSRYLDENVISTRWVGIDGDENLEIMETYVVNTANPDSNNFFTSDNLEIGIKIKIKKQLNEVGAGFNIISFNSIPLVRVFFNDYNNIDTISPGEYVVKFEIPAYHLATGRYKIQFDVSLPFISQINSEKINLSFELFSNSALGNRYYAQNTLSFNSIIRPNWFKEIEPVGNKISTNIKTTV
jgi:lipopolysaccharide transport system ATP-binding protein